MSKPTQIDPVNTGAEYVMNEDGVISRRFSGEESEVGQYKGGILTMKPEAAKYRRWAAQWLTEKGLTVGSVTVETNEAPKKAATPEPPQHPRHGDKTPAFVEWLEENDLPRFKMTYGVIGALNKKTNLWPATRKCHRTYKVESGVMNDNTLSWDAPDGTERNEEES